MSIAANHQAGAAEGEIAHRLNTPQDRVDLPGLAARWFTAQAVFRMKGMAAIAGDPGLAGRIRGAFGRRLMEGASREALDNRPCPWSPPCALEALWRKQGRIEPGFDHASPWVLAVDPRADGDLDVTLTMFGFATDWAPAALEAMTAALRNDVDWRAGSGLFLPRAAIAGRRMRESEGLTLPPPASAFTLEFLSPLALSGADPRERPASLIVNLARRLEGLARWQDATLAGQLDMAEIASIAHGLDYEFRDAHKVEWLRGSRRQDQSVPMRGLMAALEISGQAASHPDLAALLALGASCHIGADIAFGCGRFELTVFGAAAQ